MISDDEIARYRRDGFLHLPGLFSGEELDQLRAAADRLMDEAVVYGQDLDRTRGPIALHDDHGFTEWDEMDERRFLYARGSEGERVFRRAEGIWDRDPIFRIASANPLLVNAAHQVVGRPLVGANDSMVVKMPGAGAAVPWHRDPVGKELIAEVGDASSDFTCDIYLDESTAANGALRAIPGSHRGGYDDLHPLDFDHPDAVVVEAQPGDVLFHSTGVLHGSPTNASGGMRRTFYVHFRPLEVLGKGFWDRPQEWIESRLAMTRRLREERVVSRFRDPEPLLEDALVR